MVNKCNECHGYNDVCSDYLPMSGLDNICFWREIIELKQLERQLNREGKNVVPLPKR